MKCEKRSTHKVYAVKILKSSLNTDMEIEVLKTCRGEPNVVELIEVVRDDEYTYIVTELLEGPELFEYVQKNRLSENEARKLFEEILKAVEFMHKEQIVHRDLKLENIMFAHGTSSTLKLIDFGFATRISNRLMDTPCYTLEYAAPEILSNKKYSKACDLWSLGVILYTLLCGHTPWQRRNESQDEHEIRERIKRGVIVKGTSEWQKLNKSAKDLILNLLTHSPDKRMKLQNIRDSTWFEAPVNSHSSATEIIEPAIDRQIFTEEHMPTTLVTTCTAVVAATAAPLGKSHSTSTTSINSLSESGAISEPGLSKSSSGIGIASDQFNRSISIDSSASTIRNEQIPYQDDLDDSKEILVSTVASESYYSRYEPLEDAIETEVISDSESELCVNEDGEYQDWYGFDPSSVSTLRHQQRSIDLKTVLLYSDEELKLPCRGGAIEVETEGEKSTSPLKAKRNRRDGASRKRKYSNSSDERWFDEPANKITNVMKFEDSECTLFKPKRFTRSSMRRQEIQ